MTEEHKQLIELVAEKSAEEQYGEKAWEPSDEDHVFLYKHMKSFQEGAEEVINNHLKYGLEVSSKSFKDIMYEAASSSIENIQLKKSLEIAERRIEIYRKALRRIHGDVAFKLIESHDGDDIGEIKQS